MQSRRAVLKTTMAGLAFAAPKLRGASVKSATGPEAMIAQIPVFPSGKLGRIMRGIHRENQASFVSYLETARAIYQRCPELVTSEAFPVLPPAMRESYREVYGGDPSDSSEFGGGDLIKRDYPLILVEQGRAQLEYNARAAEKVGQEPAPTPPPTKESLEDDLRTVKSLRGALHQLLEQRAVEVEQELAAFVAA